MSYNNSLSSRCEFRTIKCDWSYFLYYIQRHWQMCALDYIHHFVDFWAGTEDSPDLGNTMLALTTQTKKKIANDPAVKHKASWEMLVLSASYINAMSKMPDVTYTSFYHKHPFISSENLGCHHYWWHVIGLCLWIPGILSIENGMWIIARVTQMSVCVCV